MDNKWIKEIIRAVAKYPYYSIKVSISTCGVDVILRNSRILNCDIPIRYGVWEKMVYVPMEELKDTYNPAEFGLELDEIEAIHAIMKVLLTHQNDIKKLCDQFGADTRDVSEVLRDEDISDS